MTREEAKKEAEFYAKNYQDLDIRALIDQIYNAHEAEIKAKDEQINGLTDEIAKLTEKCGKYAYEQEQADERIAELEAKSKNIICLCGSTKFKTEFEQAIREESTNGNIVLSVCQFTHADKLPITKEQKITFDKLHFQKIELANQILVVNPNGYIGKSTQKEIEYAKSLGKPIKYLYELKDTK